MTFTTKVSGTTGFEASQDTIVCDNEMVTQTAHIPTFPNGSYSKITYENSGMKRYNACSHRKIAANFPSQVACWNLEPCTPKACGGKSRLIEGQLVRNIAQHAGSLLSFSSKFEEPNEAGVYCKRAFEKMQPSLSSGFSLTNFIFELRDIKTLFKLWKVHEGLTKNLAGGYLNYQFGWKLFLQDCHEMYTRLSQWEKTLEDYLSKQGKPLIRHYRENVFEDVTSESSEDYTTKYEGATYARATNTSCVFHATMRYTYTVPTLDAEYSKLRAFREIWGIKLNASVLWEALPFSFVVDWFLNVGKYLNSIGPEYLESKVTVLDFCYSFKKTETGSFTMQIPGSKHTVGSYQVTDYQRRRGLPPFSTFGEILSHRYGTKQLLLSAALLLA